MSVLEISRVSRESPPPYDLAALFPNLSGPFTVASVALLPVRTGPSAATVWTTLTVASGSATVLYAGPDADSTGAVVVTGNCDVWVKTTVGSRTDATKAGTIRLAGGGSVTALPPTYVTSVNGMSGAVTIATGGGGGGVSIVDNGDGTLSTTSSAVVDNGDGTLSAA